MEIRRCREMPPSRPSRWCLGLQDDSVFADFEVDGDGRVYLLRISFDGYGCCRTTGKVGPMDASPSADFIRLVESDHVDNPEMASILSRYFRENDGVIWKDALEDHHLLDD